MNIVLRGLRPHMRLELAKNSERRSVAHAHGVSGSFFFLAAALCMAGPAHAAAPQFASSEQLSSDTGHILLSWQSEERVTLSMASQPDMADASRLYQGDAESYFLSGLHNGTYYLRLQGQGGAVSKTVQLSVQHQSLERAIWLTLVGAFIALSILVTILRGARDD